MAVILFPGAGVCSESAERRGSYPWWEGLARESAPLVALLRLPGAAALALLPQAVEVRLLEELLAAQPLGRVHLQAALRQGRDTLPLTHCLPLAETHNLPGEPGKTKILGR